MQQEFDTSSFAKKTDLATTTSALTAVENKIPSVTNLVKKN